MPHLLGWLCYLRALSNGQDVLRHHRTSASNLGLSDYRIWNALTNSRPARHYSGTSTIQAFDHHLHCHFRRLYPIFAPVTRRVRSLSYRECLQVFLVICPACRRKAKNSSEGSPKGLHSTAKSLTLLFLAVAVQCGPRVIRESRSSVIGWSATS